MSTINYSQLDFIDRSALVNAAIGQHNLVKVSMTKRGGDYCLTVADSNESPLSPMPFRSDCQFLLDMQRRYTGEFHDSGTGYIDLAKSLGNPASAGREDGAFELAVALHKAGKINWTPRGGQTMSTLKSFAEIVKIESTDGLTTVNLRFAGNCGDDREIWDYDLSQLGVQAKGVARPYGGTLEEGWVLLDGPCLLKVGDSIPALWTR